VTGDAHIYARFPKHLIKALDEYRKNRYLSRSAVIRIAVAQWGPLQPYLEKGKRKTREQDFEW